MIAIADATAYEVVAEGSQVPPVKQLPPIQPQTTAASNPNPTPGQSSPNQGSTQDRANPLCTGGFLPLGLLLARWAIFGQLIAQAPVQCGEAAGDLIVLDCDLDGFLAADQHAQRLGAGDGGVEQVALQHQIMLGHQGQHHGREF